jgi:hypothetical protein
MTSRSRFTLFRRRPSCRIRRRRGRPRWCRSKSAASSRISGSWFGWPGRGAYEADVSRPLSPSKSKTCSLSKRLRADFFGAEERADGLRLGPLAAHLLVVGAVFEEESLVLREQAACLPCAGRSRRARPIRRPSACARTRAAPTRGRTSGTPAPPSRSPRTRPRASSPPRARPRSRSSRKQRADARPPRASPGSARRRRRGCRSRRNNSDRIPVPEPTSATTESRVSPHSSSSSPTIARG